MRMIHSISLSHTSCIGFGEIFAISAAYEAVFLIAPKNLQALSSAVNIFFMAALPQYLTKLLLTLTTSWFISSDGNPNLNTLSAYTTAHTQWYFGLLVCISISGVLVNSLPAVDRFLVRVLAEAETADKVLDVPKKRDTFINTSFRSSFRGM